MKLFLPLLLALAALCPLFFANGQEKETSSEAKSPRPLKALLIAGGCCHDYVKQHEILYKGIQERANVRVDVVWTRDKSTNPPLPIYDNPDWAKGYDVIIHDECAASNKDLKKMENILAVHQTIPAVHLHCAMHSFRNGTDKWPKHLGIHSTSHGPQKPLEITYTNPDHPITKTLENWTTKNEELYNNHKIYDAEPLALATQKVGEREKSAIVAWTNTRQGAPSFSTTIGHNNYTVEDPRYLDLITRGLLWSAGKLNKDYLKPYTGSNVITEMGAENPDAPAKPPKDAIMVKVTAKDVQTDAGHFPWKAIDGDEKTRWTGKGPAMPNWLQLEFQKPTTVTAAEILWEKPDHWYQYKIETSKNGKDWQLAHDASANTTPGTKDSFTAKDIKFLRLTVLKQQHNQWPALWEIRLTGENGPLKLFPLGHGKKASQVNSKALAKSGNIKPRIVKLTPEEEAEILKDCQVPEGFEKTLFAPWQTANYPVYVAASPGGDLYVSSDGNGSLGRQPGRGRVLRLRDKDKDGRADEVTEFIRDIDSPRGLIWDHDRLYLLHPPHISVFFDRDGDGVAEESKRLISDIAFGFKDRPADHTTNDITMGIDGWIYIAGGDFGFLKATGTDGRTLQHRGGGVIRFRPDGSGLELFATGTRNILATPISPTLDMFARDNTNDGGGWDVRFHHLTALSDHGYPRLYKNFEKEHIHPLADYGGGSGCGGVYIHEPGFPDEWNKAPFTCDWGKAGLFRHSVAPDGASFKETEAPQKFIRVTRPTDADVDGMSAVYQASWKGPATFNWNGPEQGYIVRVTPKGYKPEPLPDFEKMSDEELVESLESPSQVRTLAAQRTIIRRGDDGNIAQLLYDKINQSIKIGDKRTSTSAGAAAIYSAFLIEAGYITHPNPEILVNPQLTPIFTRALGDPDRNLGDKNYWTTHHLEGILSMEILPPDSAIRNAAFPDNILEAIISIARLNLVEHSPLIANHLSSEDLRIRHTAYQALAKMSAHEAAFSKIASDDIDTRKAAAWALMRMHKPEVVNELLSRLGSEKDAAKRKPLLSVLARLYHKEAEWKGDSWGTRPDTRGPYYQLATWEQSERILTTLKTILKDAEAEEAAFIITKLNKNRIPANDALDRIIDLALNDEKLIPVAISQMANAPDIPPRAIPLVLKGARTFETGPAAHADAVKVLIQTDHPEAPEAAIAALINIGRVKGSGKSAAAARGHFLKAPKLENHHLALEKLALEKPDTLEGNWAAMAVLELASRKSGSPESREMSLKAIEQAWSDNKKKIAFINAARELRNPVINKRIRAALSDPNEEVAKAAKDAATRLKIQTPGTDKTARLSTFDADRALKNIIRYKNGDAALGEAIFTRATCNACHTVTQKEAQKGPYLGNIAETYRRNELAEAILHPEKTIAQGFATNLITRKDGTAVMGFVTDESGDIVKLRDIASNEHTVKKSQIKERTTLPSSLMPPGLMNNFTVHEAASLLDYLDSLIRAK